MPWPCPEEVSARNAAIAATTVTAAAQVARLSGRQRSGRVLSLAGLTAGADIAGVPTQLALTWDGRVSFVLTENFALKKIKLLDVVLEGQEKAGKGDNNFDADVAISTGELGKLIPDLVEALGGPLKLGEAGTSTTDTAPLSTPPM